MKKPARILQAINTFPLPIKIAIGVGIVTFATFGVATVFALHLIQQAQGTTHDGTVVTISPTGQTTTTTTTKAGVKTVTVKQADGQTTTTTIKADGTTTTATDTTTPASTPTSGGTSTGTSSGTTSTGTTTTTTTTTPTGPTCNQHATTANFSTQLTATTTGQTLCLATGNYGTFTGVSKAITITAESGATPTMQLDFEKKYNPNGFTLDGLTISYADVLGNSANFSDASRPRNFTIKNSTFNGAIRFDSIDNANISLDHNTHNNIDTNSNCTAAPARIWLSYSSNNPSGVTISNSYLSGGNTDGVQAGAPANIINNEFYNIFEKGSSDCSHTDAIQLVGGGGMTITGNYIHSTADGIVAYDGTDHNTITNNVIDLKTGRWGIELYSDDTSVVRNNTLVYNTGCAYSPCGHIMLDKKTSSPNGHGTIIENNIVYDISQADGSTAASERNNMFRSGAGSPDFNGIPIFAGGSSPTTWAGFKLAANSPGIHGATDGGAVGIR